MNAGVIASRYAKALLKFVKETGNGDKVYAQAGILALRMQEIGQLKDYIENHQELGPDRKMQLMETALGEPMAMELTRFAALVIGQRRTVFFHRMLCSFISQYREACNIKVGRLVTALPADGLKERMEEIFRAKTGAEVQLEVKVNPDILGGFVFELDDWKLDASVVAQLKKISRGLIDNNNRIV